MKKFFSILLASALVLGASAAVAQTSRIYFAGYIGLTTFNALKIEDEDAGLGGTVTPDNAPNFAGALGLRFNRNFRLEGEYSYRDASFGTANIDGFGEQVIGGDVKMSSVLVNAYYDFDLGWKTQPYVMAGLGVSQYKGDLNDPSGNLTEVNDTAYGMTWTAGAGLKYRVSPRFAWTGGYRYLDGTDVNLGNTTIDTSAHEFRVGIEYDLGY